MITSIDVSEMNTFFPDYKKWHVIVSHTIHYKKAAATLEKLGLSFYLPLQRQLHKWSDRKKWVNVPIFSPYIFLFTNNTERKLLFQSCNFFSFLSCEGNPVTVKLEEVEKVKFLCDYSSDMKMEQSSAKKGDKVEVIKGPFLGMTGYALQEHGKHRFMVLLTGLGQFASVDVESSWLRVC